MRDDQGAAPGTGSPHARRRPRPPVRRRGRPQLGDNQWAVAVAEVIVAIAAAVILPRLEKDYGWSIGFSYEASTAQATLGAIAGGMITLTGFVLTTVTLIVQTVQSQSPRLLRALNRTDRTPLLFGTFIATFTFALVALSQVSEHSVPTISVLLALLMVLVSAGLFLRLLVTFRTTLTSGGLARTVGGELRRLIESLYPAGLGPASPPREPHEPRGPSGPAWTLRHSGPPGVFQSFDEPRVVELASAAGSEFTFVPAVGDFVVTGAVLVTGTGTEPGHADLARLIRIGPVRTLEQDPAYGIRLLADIAIRALSSAVNDPTSAVQVIDQLDDVLHRLAWRALGDGRLLDTAGHITVRWPAPTWDAFLALAIDEIMSYGASTLQVSRRLQALLEDLAGSVPAARLPPVTARIEALDRAVRQAYSDPAAAAEALTPDRQGIGSPRRPGAAAP
jgi:uncharacterized membrane protein